MSSFDEKREALRQQRQLTGKKLLKSTLFLAGFLGFMALFMVPMGKSILCHTIGGFCAGIAAHLLFVLLSLL